ncbi:MAG: DNA repair protein RecO [Chitinispirillales bacterium]|jgi:DNA repair protein RecO|nr:DNA repair protein RecO [Chitinispirillales bacterium]
MAAEKTDSVILSLTPYRETSCILRLFTQTHGLLHGVAKGVRKFGKSSIPLDRGFLIESLVYYKPNRDLHTLGSLHVSNFFPGIRSNITKSIIRDIALELYLKTIPQSEPHPKLFNLIVDFFTAIDGLPRSEILFPILWRFIHEYCSLAGFGIDARACGKCGIDIRYNRADAMSVSDDKYFLNIGSGALVCKKCMPSKNGTGYKINDTGVNMGIEVDADGLLDGSVVRFMDNIDNDFPQYPSKNDRLRITELLLLYCRHHFDIRGRFNSAEFIKSF